MFTNKRPVSVCDDDAQPRKKIRAIIGAVQSGKTGSIIDHIQRSDHICVVIVRNVNADVCQFMNACRRAKLPAITLCSDRQIQALSCSLILAPKVVVLLANAKNVKKACAALEAANSPSFELFLDEADKIGFSTEPSDRSFRAELLRLQDRAVGVVYVTATMFNFMTLPDVGGRMTAADITALSPSAAYCGVYDILFGTVRLCDRHEDDQAPWYIGPEERGCDAPDVPSAPESMEYWMRGLLTADTPPDHPVLALARMGNRIDTIHVIARTAEKVSRRILPVVYTGDGVSVPAKLLEYLDARGVQLQHARYKRLGGYVTLTTLTLQQFLSVLRDTAVLGAAPVIVVCAGLLAARGVNFTDASYKWGLTHEYFLPAKTTNVTELEQGLRLLGNKPWSLDQFRPVLTTKHSVMRNIDIGCQVQAGALENLSCGADSLLAATRAVTLEEKPSVRYANNMIINSVALSD